MKIGGNADSDFLFGVHVNPCIIVTMPPLYHYFDVTAKWCYNDGIIAAFKGIDMNYNDSEYHVTRQKRKGMYSDWENMVADMLDRIKVNYGRQITIEGFRTDFVLVGLNLIVEVDDPSHGWIEEKANDRRQDELTALIGFSTIRIPTRDIENDYEAVVARLQREIKSAKSRSGIKQVKPPKAIEREVRISRVLPPPKFGRRGRKPHEQRRCGAVLCNGRAYKENPYCPKCTRRFERHGDAGVVLKRGRKAASS